MFSLLPPENATGNFTKIVQRVPVRIAVPAEMASQGWQRAGLSVVVRVDPRTPAPDPAPAPPAPPPAAEPVPAAQASRGAAGRDARARPGPGRARRAPAAAPARIRLAARRPRLSKALPFRRRKH